MFKPRRNFVTCVCLMLAILILLKTNNLRSLEGRRKFIRISKSPRQWDSLSMKENTASKEEEEAIRSRTTFLLEPFVTTPKTCFGTCDDVEEKKWKMTIFVKSTASNQDRRRNIRQSWGSIHEINRASISTLFVIGKPRNEELNKLVQTEHLKYGDILQYDGGDNYSNITIKTLSGMQWASENLPDESLYTSTDDDFVINMGRMAGLVDSLVERHRRRSWGKFPILCSYIKGVNERVIRFDDPKYAKWAISKEDYQWSTYPAYCHGGLYTTSVHMVRQLYSASKTQKLLHLDDVFITGILRREIGISDELVVSSGWPIGFHFGNEIDLFQHLKTFIVYGVDRFLNLFRSYRVCSCNHEL